MNSRLNKYKYPGAKRLMLEAQELKDKTEDYCAGPIDDNLFEWHFTIRGPPDTAFEGGYYHGRLSFPTEYPMKPPSIILLTPNGRFATNKKVCLSISGYHPETWQPSWSVRTALLALIAFMPTKSNRAIASLDFPDSERRKLAEKSRSWRCETCGLIKDLLKHPEESDITNQDGHLKASPSNDASSSNRDYQSVSVLCNETEQANNGDITENSQTASQMASETGYREEPDESSNPKLEPGIYHSSEKEKSVISNDSMGEESSKILSQSRDSSSERSEITSFQESTNPSRNAAPDTTASTSDNRRSYPTLVYASIFILLFLLVLRRVVMLIQ